MPLMSHLSVKHFRLIKSIGRKLEAKKFRRLDFIENINYLTHGC